MRLTHSSEEADEVRREGRAAAKAGASEHDNPYDRLTMAYHHWRTGFEASQQWRQTWKREVAHHRLRMRVPGYSKAISSTFVEG
jgi:hypothetical protein